MPQMKPMMWLYLFLLIVMVMLMIQIMMNFINFINKLNNNKFKFFNKKFNMKW